MTRAINQAVGCHYFSPGPQLPPQPLRGLLPISVRPSNQCHGKYQQTNKTLFTQNGHKNIIGNSHTYPEISVDENRVRRLEVNATVRCLSYLSRSAQLVMIPLAAGLYERHTHSHASHTHPINGRLSGTTRVSQYQKGKNQSEFY